MTQAIENFEKLFGHEMLIAKNMIVGDYGSCRYFIQNAKQPKQLSYTTYLVTLTFKTFKNFRVFYF